MSWDGLLHGKENDLQLCGSCRFLCGVGDLADDPRGVLAGYGVNPNNQPGSISLGWRDLYFGFLATGLRSHQFSSSGSVSSFERTSGPAGKSGPGMTVTWAFAPSCSIRSTGFLRLASRAARTNMPSLTVSRLDPSSAPSSATPSLA